MTTPYTTLVHHSTSVHQAIAALFEQLHQRVAEGLDGPVLDDGVACATTILRGHHAYEEEVLLPELRRRGAEGPWDQVTEEHQALADHLDALRAGENPLPHVEALAAMLPGHFQLEDEQLTEAFWRGVFSSEEEARAFGKRVAAHNRASLKPTAKLLPLLLYNLSPAQRALFTDRMPRFVVDGLVPFAFRASWRDLRPFMAYAPERWTPGPLHGLRSYWTR